LKYWLLEFVHTFLEFLPGVFKLLLPVKNEDIMMEEGMMMDADRNVIDKDGKMMPEEKM
jgi:hypothetical protein